MSDRANDDVNADVVDNVTDDHDAGLGTSAEDMETHNPDIADYDKAIAAMDAADDEEADSSGGTIKTDDADAADADASDADKDKDDGARIPKSRLDEVIKQRDEKDKALNDLRVENARDKAILEGRLAALERPAEKPTPIVDPLDDILRGEPQEVLDKFTEDPRGFVNMIKAATRAETTASIYQQREEETYQKTLISELDKFRAERDDFMPNADKLVEIMNSNPIHNVISAYAYEIEIPALRSQLEEATKGMEDKVSAARAEGVTEGKKQAIKEIRAKGNATVLDGSAASQSGARANAGAGLETGGDPNKLREQITANLLKSRGAT
jgi:hypothetical protein